MVPDLCALIEADHRDQDQILVAMVGTDPPHELVSALDSFRIGLAVHVAAESSVFDLLLTERLAPQGLRQIASRSRDAHLEQQRICDALNCTRPSSDEWFTLALELRVKVLDHALQTMWTRWMLQDQVASPIRRELTRVYATTRLRAFGRTPLRGRVTAALDSLLSA
jgi:hypothetical protein